MLGLCGLYGVLQIIWHRDMLQAVILETRHPSGTRSQDEKRGSWLRVQGIVGWGFWDMKHMTENHMEEKVAITWNLGFY